MDQLSYNFTVPLGRLVSRLMSNMKLSDEDEENLYDYAEDFLRDLNSDTFPRTKVYEDDVLPSSVINFPKDMLGWSKIGYKSGSQVVPLGNNDNLAFNDNLEVTPTPDQVDNILLPNAFYELYWPLELPRTPVPTFRINYGSRKIYIDPQVKIPNFYMEYLSSCVDIDAGLLIHPFYQTGLLLHMRYWISMDTPNRKSDVPTYRALLDAETERYRQRTAPTSLDILTAFKRVLY